MVEEKSDEDEKVITGKNVIYNNFENKDFLNNFRSSLENIKNLNKSGEFSNCSTFKEVLNKYGKDDTYKYDIHISLTGYFFCDNIKVFIKTLYIYMFYYVKLYYAFKNFSYTHLFFHLSHKYVNGSCGNSALFIREKRSLVNFNNGKKKSRQIKHYLSYSHQSQQKRNIAVVTKNDNKHISILNGKNDERKDNTLYERNVITTNDGYVIIPILCEWIKRIFENFNFLIRSESFLSSNKCKTNVKDNIHLNYLYKNSIILKKANENHNGGYNSKNCLLVKNIPLKNNFQGIEEKTNIKSSYEDGINSCGASNSDEQQLLSVCVTPHGKVNMNMDRNMDINTNINIIRTASHSKTLSGHVVGCNTRNETDETSIWDMNIEAPRLSTSNETVSTDSYMESCTDSYAECNNNGHPKRIKRKKQHNNSRNDKKKKNNPFKKEETNKIKYQYNNAKVNLCEFRIKDCNHISLASNRNNKDVQNDIAYMYKDMKHHFSSCYWDLVMFEYNESIFPQERKKNNFLNEIFRFKNFAIS
ncbi:uncharacterized protein MKS88_000034 [Plasmodium brasilianum]|uniref:uncharacterized protein n=1 Tax=Plasmodium brasilianum TaxID=5824 RepID=UPI00350E3F62|nr:hypothetical protein MKS88_000034 [Plasmodium brasilianum]